MSACTVLVVDDDETIREVLTELLTIEGYAPIPAADGNQAVALIADDPPDVVLLDLDLPGRSGQSVAREVHPRKANEPPQRTFDRGAYRERKQVERLINRLKKNRVIATRSDKLAVRYHAMLTIATIVICI